jgi:hypothetical protein
LRFEPASLFLSELGGSWAMRFSIGCALAAIWDGD